MDLRFNYDQRARLELIAIHTGMSVEQLLTEAAELLVEIDGSDAPASDAPVEPKPRQQHFLSAVEIDERLVRLLRH